MINATLRDEFPCVELRGRFGIEYIANVLRTGRLMWFTYVERMEDDNLVKRCINVTVESRAPRDRPRKI